MILGGKEPKARTRAAGYAAAVGCLAVAAVAGARATWQPDPSVHTFLEAPALVLSLFIALIAVTRYRSRPNVQFLFFAAAFLGAAVLGGLHMVVTSPLVAHWSLEHRLFPSPLNTIDGWSWFVARTVFAVLLWQSMRGGGLAAPPGTRDGSGRRWVVASGLLALCGVLTVAVVPLGPYVRPVGWLVQPAELIPAGFLALAVAGCLRRGAWARDAFKHWLALGLIFNLGVHLPFTASSAGLGTPLHDLAHVLIILGHACVLTGLVLGMHELFRQADASADAMARANHTLRLREAQFAEAQRLAHLGSWEWDVAADRVTWSDEMYRVYGYTPGAIDVRLATFIAGVHPDDRSMAKDVIGHAMESGETFQFMHRIVRPDGEVRYLRAQGAVARGPNGRPLRLWGTGQDVTDVHLAQAALRDSEERFRLVAESALEAIVSTDSFGSITFLNRAAERIFEVSKAEMLGRSAEVLMPPRYRAAFRAGLERVRTGGAPRTVGRAMEMHGQTKDGREFPIELSLAGWDMRGEVFYTAIIRDITRRRQAERDAVEASRRMVESRENVRLHLAQELHDGPLQDLYGIQFRLGELGRAAADENGYPAVADIQSGLHSVIDALRNTCQDLRPPALAPFGLEVAIRSHAERFRALHPGLDLVLDLEPDKQRLSEWTRLALYRIYQQALENVARHAEAEHVQVSLKLCSNRATLAIRDDGQGFAVPEGWLVLARQGRFGLLGASERAEAIGGRLDVESAPGEGTLVRATVELGPGDGEVSPVS